MPFELSYYLEFDLRASADSGVSIGTAAITLHGRSRQQRYTKNADWEYISECAALIKDYHRKGDDLFDTVREVDERSQAGSKVYFLGNGDCYSHVDYNTHLEDAKVDSVMIARGALIKPVCTDSLTTLPIHWNLFYGLVQTSRANAVDAPLSCPVALVFTLKKIR